ncbi:heme uptake protein IsdC [Oceanobacillus polygoni]|uniref:Heme uptake protein IsdC n=1 Tax=Oceanobacillus polygoni TaxID=1235259 RepID=A0A9X0YV69_9BACI|nr:heme uptake protein IsdC [Oceanobacillus polygoni]MBP2078636.1 heme uptake protein IsdC [Oceanobacillus polygoni]
MKRVLTVLLIICFAFLSLSINVSAATDLADGTYTVDYTILHADNDSASIANDYWNKPATVTIDGDTTTVQLTLNHSTWITEYQTPSGGGFSDVRVVSTNEGNAEPGDNTRVVEFTVDNLAEIIPAKIHVIVPDIDYDHNYTIRHSFDLNSATLISGGESSEDDSDLSTSSTDSNATNENSNDNDNTSESATDSNEAGAGKTVENPPTSDSSLITWATLLLVVSGLYLVSRVVMKRLT